MNISVESKTANPLFNRQEVAFKITYESATPSRKQVREALSTALGVAIERILLVKLVGSFGVHTAQGLARIYEKPEDAKKDKKHLLLRDGLVAKEEKKAAAKAPAKK